MMVTGRSRGEGLAGELGGDQWPAEVPGAGAWNPRGGRRWLPSRWKAGGLRPGTWVSPGCEPLDSALWSKREALVVTGREDGGEWGQQRRLAGAWRMGTQWAVMGSFSSGHRHADVGLSPLRASGCASLLEVLSLPPSPALRPAIKIREK